MFFLWPILSYLAVNTATRQQRCEGLLDFNSPARWGGDNPGAVGVVEVGVGMEGGAAQQLLDLKRDQIV